MKKVILQVFLATLALFYSCKDASKSLTDFYSGWENYAGTKDGNRYSSQEQINVHNVSKLRVAWRYSSLDKDTGKPFADTMQSHSR